MIEKCARCGFENLEGSIFCQKCGTQLITKDVSFRQKIQGWTLLKKTFWAFVLVLVVFGLIWLSPIYETSQSTNTTSPTPDLDPIVECQFTHLPWKEMRSSECATSYECQTGNNWEIYKSQEECTKAQLQQASSSAYDPDPITTCQFKNLPAQMMRESSCKNAVECQVGDKWHVYSSQSQCTQYQSLQISNDWSKYRTARITDLKTMLQDTEDEISKINLDTKKYADTLNDLTEDYKQGEITSEYYNEGLTKFEDLLDVYKKYLEYLEGNKKAISALISRFQNGENVTPEEEKAILGF